MLLKCYMSSKKGWFYIIILVIFKMYGNAQIVHFKSISFQKGKLIRLKVTIGKGEM